MFICLRELFETKWNALEAEGLAEVFLRLYHFALAPPIYLSFKPPVKDILDDITNAIQNNVSLSHFILLRLLMVSHPQTYLWFIEFGPMVKMIFESIIACGQANDTPLLCEILNTLTFAAFNLP